MNYTENYHLPQWDETDRVMRTDFNQMCADMEAGIMDARSRAEAGDAKVQKTAADALSKAQASSNAAIAKAQTSADNAQKSADKAQATADAAYCPTYKPYAVGNYVGTGERMEINVGFRPRFLIIAGGIYGYQTPPAFDYTYMCGLTNTSRAQFTDTGFVLPLLTSSYPELTRLGEKYDYIAFR